MGFAKERMQLEELAYPLIHVSKDFSILVSFIVVFFFF